MVCDKCHEDLGGFQARLTDGSVVCAQCLKAMRKKKSKNVPTTDTFIKLCRKLSKLAPSYDQWIFQVAAIAKSGRCYTNGNVLISDFAKVPKCATFMSLFALEPLDGVSSSDYPKINTILPPLGPHYVEIPKIVYRLLLVFKDVSPLDARVVFHNGEITVWDTNGAEVSMRYTNVVMNNPDPLALNISRLLLLKPKRIEFDCNSATPIVKIVSSYDKTVNGFKHVLLAGMRNG